MDLSAAYDQFSIRLYQWAQNDFMREIRTDFPFLSTINYRHTLASIAVIRDMPRSEQDALAVALVKRGHDHAVLLTHQNLTDEEKMLVRRYQLAVSSFLNSSENKSVDVVTQVPAKNKLLASISQKLNPILGVAFEPVSKSSWKWITPVEGWNVQTVVGVASKGLPILYYDHYVDRKDYSSCYQKPAGSISMLTWFGISRTEWLRYSTIEDLSSSLRLLINHFMVAAPTLLQNLSASD
jgi:hypothetical protein